MKLSILQAYCLDEMGIERFVSRQAHDANAAPEADTKAYWLMYQPNKDARLEQQNQQLLANILNALAWDQKDILYYDFSTELNSADRLGPRICGLCFGEETELFREMASNNSTMVLLPALELLHENVDLKRETWNKIKQFKV